MGRAFVIKEVIVSMPWETPLRIRVWLVLGLLLCFLSPPGIAGAFSPPLKGLSSNPGDPGAIPIVSCQGIVTPGNYQVAIDLQSNGDCLVVTSSDVTIDCSDHLLKGQSHEGAGILVKNSGGGHSDGPQNVHIHHCKISGYHYAIAVESGSSIQIDHNDLSRNYDDTNRSYFGSWLGLVDGGGLRFDRVQDGVVEENIANDQAIGIDIRGSRRIRVFGNTTSTNSAFCILFVDTSGGEIANNLVEGNLRWCIFKAPDQDLVVPGCDSAGIMLEDGSGHNMVHDNTISGQNGNGIFLRNSDAHPGNGNQILNNTVDGAIWNGLEIGFCEDVLVAGNTFAHSKFGAWVSYVQNAALRGNSFSNIEIVGAVVRNTHKAVIQENHFESLPVALRVIGDESDKQFGWTLKDPFDDYRSYENLIVKNSFSKASSIGIHLANSTGNHLLGNVFSETATHYVMDGNSINNIFGE
jgi:parallel beta-helix repeat protein